MQQSLHFITWRLYTAQHILGVSVNLLAPEFYI